MTEKRLTTSSIKIGDLFGHLTVTQKNAENVECLCSCGNVCVYTEWQIFTGGNISCGCLVPGYGNRKSASDASINGLINRYKQKAKSRKPPLSWELTREECVLMFFSECNYCGAAPANFYNVYITKEGKAREGSEEWMKSATLSHNGIDRINSDYGYSNSNCVPCCKICNYAKNDLPLTEFLSWLERIANFNE